MFTEFSDRTQIIELKNNFSTINLSNYELSIADLSLLERGLNFIPTRKTLPVSNILNCQNKLIRSIKLRYHFRSKTSSNTINNEKPNESNIFKNKFIESQNWTPPSELMSMDVNDTIREIKQCTNLLLKKYHLLGDHNNTKFNIPAESSLIKLSEVNNMEKCERDSLNSLKNNKNIIIKPADKGSATVIMNRTNYIDEAHRQLNNDKYYIKLTQPVNSTKQIHSILLNMYENNYITKKQLQYLSGPSEYKPRCFYLLPKIHKKPDLWPNPNMPEGRPIVSDINSETYRISELIDYYLNPLATKHFSYIKNSYEFVNKIKDKTVNNDFLLVTGDISALYTNMNIDRMLECVRKAFNNNLDPSRPDEAILKLLEISLKNNYFNFNNTIYKQILGCAMGKRFAPALANLYLLELDDKATTGFPIKPLFFVRYLDDIFFVWPGNIESLKRFEIYLNNLIPDIKITLEYNTDNISFLDTLIYKTNSTLQTRTFFKQTDTHQLLHTESFHPKHTFNGLLKSQLIRFKRLSSTKSDYDNTCKTLFKYLSKRGYKQSNMRNMQHKIYHSYKEKETLIVNNGAVNDIDNANNANQNKELLPIIIDYSKIGTEITKNYKQILNQNNFFHQFKLVTAYTNAKNIKQILVRSNLDNVVEDGAYYGCDQPRCITCRYHANGSNHFQSENNKTQYKLKDKIYCKSTNLVYLITCRLCKKQYVGETGRTLRDRLNDHRSAIKNNKKTPIAIHFNMLNHSVLDLSIMPIELIKNNNSSAATRRLREQYWQLKLNTLFPYGINNLPTD